MWFGLLLILCSIFDEAHRIRDVGRILARRKLLPSLIYSHWDCRTCVERKDVVCEFISRKCSIRLGAVPLNPLTVSLGGLELNGSRLLGHDYPCFGLNHFDASSGR